MRAWADGLGLQEADSEVALGRRRVDLFLCLNFSQDQYLQKKRRAEGQEAAVCSHVR